MIKVIITDDHVLYRAAVKTALSSKKDIKVIAEVDNGLHLLDLLKAVQTDVILLDIQMPVMDGIITLPEVKRMYPNIRIIMLTMVEDQSMIRKLMALGANSYLVKTSDPEVIYQAIKTCYEHEFFFNEVINLPGSNDIAGKIPSVIKLRQEKVMLSEKEIAVLRLMCEEKSAREIAEAAGLSLPALEEMKNKLKLKTGARSTAGLILFALKNNLFGNGITL